MTLFMNIHFSVFGYFIKLAENIYITNLIVLIPLIFLFLTTLYGLFNLRIFKFYKIYISSNQETDAYSILFLSGFICKIGFPLCLNFLQILRIDTNQTSLEAFLGVMDLLPVFGKNFAIFYPSILIIFVILNTFDIIGKISKILGFESFYKNFESEVEEIRLYGIKILEKCISFFFFIFC
jgi:hypothetical protein